MNTAFNRWDASLARVWCATLATLLVAGCASTAPASTDPGNQGEGECIIEARNETEVTLSVSYRAGLVTVGELVPGGRHRFAVGCGDGEVVVQGRREAQMGSGGARCNVFARVRPVEGQVVRAILRLSQSSTSRTASGCRGAL